MFRWQVSSDSICSERQRTAFRSAGGAVRRSASPSLFLRDRASIRRPLEPRLCVLLFQLSCILLFEVLDEPPSGGSSKLISTSAPLARSSSIAWIGIPPNPSPARKKASLASRCERCQTLEDR